MIGRCCGMLLALLLLMPISGGLRAAQEPVVLEHADLIEVGDGGDGSSRSVSGHVSFRQGQMVLRCDRARYLAGSDQIELLGHVVFIVRSIEIHGDRGTYDTKRNIARLEGQVRGRFAGRSFTAKAGRVVYDRLSDRVTLQEKVLAWYANQQLDAPQVVLQLVAQGRRGAKRIDEAVMENGGCYAARDTRSTRQVAFDQCRGNDIRIRFSDTLVPERIMVSGEAETLYHLYDEGGQFSGINYASGDSIAVRFAGGHMSSIKVSGGVEGKQYPVRFRGNPSINLQCFAWKEAEMPFRSNKAKRKTR